MPLGNGAARGLASAAAGIYSDVRRYDTAHSAAGDTGFSPITKQSLGSYEKVIAATPGLSQWWPLGYAITPTPSYYKYGNVCGATTLQASGAGSDTLVQGIVPGSRAQAVKLSGGRYLWAEDYRCWPMGWETIMAVEFWVNFQSFGTDSAIFGEWDTGARGWMIYSSSGDLRIYCGSNNLTLAAGTLATGKTYHVVACWGGSGTPTADYVSRVYLNSVDVLHGNLVLGGGTDTVTTNAHFQVNAHGNDGGAGGGSTGPHGMTIQHISIYNRMLQPLEVKQHYTAGFARG